MGKGASKGRGTGVGVDGREREGEVGAKQNFAADGLLPNRGGVQSLEFRVRSRLSSPLLSP